MLLGKDDFMVKAILLFVVGLILICLAGDRLVDAAVIIAKKLNIPEMVVGATIVSLGTTLPEILVSTTAAFSGSTEIAAGNAFGSIICNTALIAGLTQLIKPAENVNTAPLKWRSIFFALVMICLNYVGYSTGKISRPAGFALISLFIVYAYLNIRMSSVDGDSEDAQTEADKNTTVFVQLAILAICAALLYIGAKLLVDNGVFIAETVGVPQRVIAVTFIALGTSLPELVTSIVSIIKGYENVGFGNIIGANTLNMLLVMGIPSAVAGIPLSESTTLWDMPIALIVMTILILPILIRKKSSRIQGVVLLGIYAYYCASSFI